MSLFEDLKILSGNAHPELAKDICAYLGVTLGRSEAFKFSNDNTFVRVLENIREKDVFIIQPISTPVNDNLMELLIMIDAAKRASAGRITAVIPHYAYGRTDKKDQPRVAITARLVADFISVAGADRVLTVDLHAGQIQGFFNIPVDELTAAPIISGYFQKLAGKDLVVVATDVGDAKRARDMARLLDAPIAIIEKQRLGNQDKVRAANLIGNVEGKKALAIDDEIGTGGTIVAAVNALAEHGAAEIYCAATHGLLNGDAAEKLKATKLKELVVTDTVPISKEKRSDRVKVLSVASLLGEAIHRIHSGLSVGAMFDM
ncbi:MAG: ribose-phosphate pyrophosphokinase [Chloroflexi bacterium]|nr:ribose-phosphate pyrophosphokinase [Chloroflexota bacterium]